MRDAPQWHGFARWQRFDTSNKPSPRVRSDPYYVDLRLGLCCCSPAAQILLWPLDPASVSIRQRCAPDDKSGELIHVPIAYWTYCCLSEIERSGVDSQLITNSSKLRSGHHKVGFSETTQGYVHWKQ